MIGFTILIVMGAVAVSGLVGLFVYGFCIALIDKEYPLFFSLLGCLLALVLVYLGYYLYSIGV